MIGSDSDDGSTSQSGPTPRGAITSDTLLKGNKEITIDHFGQIYRLRVTATGKLILTK